MTKLIPSIAFLLTVFIASAGEFKVKLDIETVDHQSGGIKVTAFHREQEVMMQTANEEGQVKLKLEEGKLYHLLIQKPGYRNHMIHNVHAEGMSKFNIVLLKGNANGTGLQGSNREFVSVKEMTIPADQLSEGVTVIEESSLSDAEKKDLASVQKVAKSQQKAQKKIDKLSKKEAKVKLQIQSAESDVQAGKLEETAAEQKKLKLQKKLVKLKKAIDKLEY